MTVRKELLQKHAELEREVRVAEVQVARATPGVDKIQAQHKLDELRVRLGELEWKLGDGTSAP